MPATPVESNELRNGEQAKALLAECFELYRNKLVDIGRASIEMSGDLFEGNTFVAKKDVDEFKSKRLAWVDRFHQALSDLYERRMSGARRKGRRPDFDASIATLRVLTAFDQEKQAALVASTAFLLRLTRRELDALDLRIDTLIPVEHLRDLDNPFGPPYILDAIGVSARTIYPNPRIWRPFMERVVADLSPAANKVYIKLNRHLADRGVLPEIKAALRARSDLRPADDRDLIPTFSKMLHEAGQAVPTDIVVPNLSGERGTASVFDFASSTEKAPDAIVAIVPSSSVPMTGAPGDMSYFAAPALAEGFAKLGRQVPASMPRHVPADALFPDLDPLMALGTSTPLFNTLGHWQRIDLPTELAKVLPRGAAGGAAVVPLNLIPHIRAAVGSQIANSADRITTDVIALLFDYVFRDASIPEALRKLFSRLQVPVLKAALLDRTFFSDRAHPARRLLDHLADAAVGATHDAGYLASFEREAMAVVDSICFDFEIDVQVFALGDERLVQFIDAEKGKTETAVKPDVDSALAAEHSEFDRAEVRAIVRDKLAGLELPFDVRGFVETVWADYLASVRKTKGAESTEWTAAVRTLDDLLWSIVAKERTAQKARLTKMIPALIMGLKKGCAAVGASADRATAFFEALYPLHVAAIKPEGAVVDVDAAGPQTLAPAAGAARGRPNITARNVHDFVSEMVVGTWVSVRGDGAEVNARLTWVSPKRTKYIFTSRSNRRSCSRRRSSRGKSTPATSLSCSSRCRCSIGP